MILNLKEKEKLKGTLAKAKANVSQGIPEIPEIQSIDMGNAVENIKKICKYETKPNDEDGVAYVIEHLL